MKCRDRSGETADSRGSERSYPFFYENQRDGANFVALGEAMLWASRWGLLMCVKH